MREVISGHSPEALREEVLSLIEDDELLSDKEKVSRLSRLLGKLWNCNDIAPSDAVEILNDTFSSYLGEETSKGSTYAVIARKIKPVLEDYL